MGINEDYASGYRSKDDFSGWYENDPVTLQRAKLLAAGVSESTISEIETAINELIENSVRKASEARFPDASELLNGVFV